MYSKEILSKLPSVDQALQDKRFTDLLTRFDRQSVTPQLRAQLDATRQQLLKTKGANTGPGSKDNSTTLWPHSDDDTTLRHSIIGYLHQEVLDALTLEFSPSLKRVFNLTGTILHTNLGRAPYPQAAIDAMINVSKGSCNLEFDLSTGKRGRRDDHVESWICKLTGAEAATTVNNNAAAVLLTLNSLAKGKNVIVSRGELIEIGGSFRVPAIMKKAGCKLREVGTTNRTHLKDYREAIGKKTAALMKVHTSNYEIQGFTNVIDASDLADLARSKNIPLIDDLGSGTLTDLTPFGLPYERTTHEALADGADIITFSGDKLLGGPQCGIIAGRADLIARIDANPMKRAMRLDKVALAALEAVLKLYGSPDTLSKAVPSLRSMARSAEEVKTTATSLGDELRKVLPDYDVTIDQCDSQIGSGALPTKTLQSYAVVIKAAGAEKTSGKSVSSLSEKFRAMPIPLIGRISNDALWLDCRVLDAELDELTAMLRSSNAVSI